MAHSNEEERRSIVRTASMLADVARKATLRHFRAAGLEADNKLDSGDSGGNSGFDPVTIADREAEQAMRAELARLRPQDGIVGEEFGNSAGSSGLTWVLDPIDGTRGYLSGTPTWGVLIAVSDESGPIYGVVDQPYIGERFCGGLGEAYYDGPLGRRPLRSRRARRLDRAILFTTFPEIGSAEERAAFERVSARARLTRYGTDCYAYALLAAGQIDLVIECGLNAYDIQAPIAVIEAAGGIVSDWQGGPAHGGGRAVAASSPELHDEVLPLLAI